MANVTKTVLKMVEIMLPGEELYDKDVSGAKQALAFSERLSSLTEYINETSFIDKLEREAVEKFVIEMIQLAEKKKLTITQEVEENLRLAVNKMYHSSNYVN